MSTRRKTRPTAVTERSDRKGKQLLSDPCLYMAYINNLAAKFSLGYLEGSSLEKRKHNM